MQAAEDIRPATAYPFTPYRSGQRSGDHCADRRRRAGRCAGTELASAQAGLDVERRSPFARTVVMTMTNGAAKLHGCDEPSLEPASPMPPCPPSYARRSAETFTAAVVDLLQRLA